MKTSDRKEIEMKLTKDEMITAHAVLYVLMNEVPYKEANKYLGDITLDRAYELLEKISKEINAW